MQNSKATVAAIAVLAMVAATIAHETAGHGGACLLLGGRITLLTSAYFHCMPPGPWIDIGGPLGNLAAALLAGLLLLALPARATRARLFAALLFAFSAFWFSGYMVYSLLLQKGDYLLALKGFGLPDVLRYGLSGVGVGIYALSVRLTARPSFPQSIMKTAWVSAALAAVAAASLFAPDRVGAMKDAFLEIGMASLPLLFVGRRSTAPEMGIASSAVWIAAAVLVYAGFVWTLGVGISQT